MAFDEAYEDDGSPRPSYGDFLDSLEGQDLEELRRRVDDQLAGAGVTFGTPPRPFSVDFVPRLLSGRLWAHLERGFAQRVAALNAFLADAYGEREIVAAGRVPADIIERATFYEPALQGVPFAHGRPIVVAGLDVVRDADGQFLILEDNVRTPSGLAYASAAREALEAVLPSPERRRPVEDGFRLLADALKAAAPEGVEDPLVVLLSDGDRNSAWYEHATIAERLGIALVLPGDLRTRGDRLTARLDGRERAVDVVYRRTDEDRLAAPDGGLTDLGELLLAPIRSGRVNCVNAFGTGIADDKLTHAYVEEMVRFYLREEPILRSVPTYDLRDDALRAELLDRIDEIVVKPRDGSGGHGILIGPHATEHDRRKMADAVRARPDAFIAQEMICLSEHPTLIEGELAPRHVDLRALVYVTGAGPVALPGGLTRVALDEGALVVNSSQNGGGKDTWVLG